MDFQRILFEYVTLARQFESLAADVSLKLVETIQAFNSLVCDEILGGAAFNKKKIKHITSKHLGKLNTPCSEHSHQTWFVSRSFGLKLHFLRHR